MMPKNPPRPPKKTARSLEDQSPEEHHIAIPDPVVVKDLASALGLGQGKAHLKVANL
jgi:hypothetical protein